MRPIDFAHATLAKGRDDFIAPEPGAGKQCHDRGIMPERARLLPSGPYLGVNYAP